MSFARKFGDKYDKKIMETATKTGIDAATTSSKRVVQKAAEATGDLIGKNIADKVTSIGKPKEKEKTSKIEEIYIPPEKRQQIIDNLRLFWVRNMAPLYKNGILKKLQIFSKQPPMIKIYLESLLKSGLKSMINQKENTMLTRN